MFVSLVAVVPAARLRGDNRRLDEKVDVAFPCLKGREKKEENTVSDYCGESFAVTRARVYGLNKKGYSRSDRKFVLSANLSSGSREALRNPWMRACREPLTLTPFIIKIFFSEK